MSVPRFFPRRLCNAISSRGKLSLAEMREVSHSNMCEGVLSSETKTPTVPPLQVLTCAIGRPRSDAVVSVSTTHAERPHLTNMTFTTAYRAGEGYQSWAISLNHIFATTQFAKVLWRLTKHDRWDVKLNLQIWRPFPKTWLHDSWW